MNPLENCLLLLGLPLGMILSGYWLAAGLRQASASERLAVGVLAGLSILLWNIAAVNFFVPLNGVWAWACLWPVLVTLLKPGSGRSLAQDFATVAINRRGLVAAILAVSFVVLLLWPLLTRPALVFYDGTSNHDAFFWISAAEHLKRHSYMVLPAMSPIHPLNNATAAIIGWHPDWGRMGAEGLLALTSSVVGLAPVKLYLAATATLIVPWIAAVFLAVRTFLVGRLGFAATLSLIVLQPVFVFFHGNSNLPNFIGALCAAAVVISTEQSLRPAPGRGVWLTLLALSFHGLLCSYPEMAPFAIMPGGLLWLRVWFAKSPRPAWPLATATAAAWIAGVAINPASGVRACSGFIASWVTARANQNWANLFDPLSVTEYLPALATLSVAAGKSLGPVIGIILSVLLAFGCVMVVRRATDRLGALFTLAGSAALIAYTLYTGFNYGWQKTVQFGGAFWAAVLPVAVIDALARSAPADKRGGYSMRAALVAVIGLFAYATVLNCLDGHKWSQRKIITQDWFTVREYSREHLAAAPVLIDGASFRMAFFHGMWATYFLGDSEVYFAGRGEENGGYLRAGVITEGQRAIPTPAAYLVSREWADAFDANSERLVLGDTVALLKNANRISQWEGLQPLNGVPENAEARVMIEVKPHSRSRLLMTLTPRLARRATTDHWAVTCQVEGQPAFTAQVSGPPPWQINVPLTARLTNRIQLAAAPAPSAQATPPFVVRDVKIESVRD
jgi:hypothetical protein